MSAKSAIDVTKPHLSVNPFSVVAEVSATG
jgi:hypothetical protein